MPHWTGFVIWVEHPRIPTANVLKEWESILRYSEGGHIQEI